MSQLKKHYNDYPETRELAARLFDAAAIDYDDRDHCALASDLADLFAAGGDLDQFRGDIGGLRNLRSYVDTIRHNYFES